MQAKTGILIGLAVILAGATFFLAKMWLDSQREGYRKAASNATKQKQIQTAEILVAKADLPAGTMLKREHLEWRVWPKKGVVKTHFVKGDRKIEDVLGLLVRRGTLAGEPLVTGRVIKMGDRGYMAALLDPGMQAVSMKVKKETSVAGFIKPRDHVDVLLTINGKKLSADVAKRSVTETILTDITVIAVNNVTNDQSTKPSVAKVITLQVTPKQAQIFTVGQRAGTVSLVLRSLAREHFVATEMTKEKMDSKSGKGAKSGKKGAAGNAKKDAKKNKTAKKDGSAEKMAADENAEEPIDEPVTSLRTWDDEVAQVLPQQGGRKKKVDSVEVIRGDRTKTTILSNKSSDEDIGRQSKSMVKKTATGFQAGQRTSGTAMSTLR